MIVLLLHFCIVPHCVFGMESFENFYVHHEHTDQPRNSLEFFGDLSTLTISDELKKKRDTEGNTLLHGVAAINLPDREFIRSLVVDHGFSVLEKNSLGEDVWIHGMRYHKSDPQFFEHFDLLYHGPTKIQWQAFCGETVAVHDALEADSKLLFQTDQRGFPLVYYAWRHKTLLKQLLAMGAMSESNIYKNIVQMWLFRGQQEAKCGRAKEHKKIFEAITIVFDSSKELLASQGVEFVSRASYVGCGLLKRIVNELMLDQHATRTLVDTILPRLKKERSKQINPYYAAILQETYQYLADA